MPPEIDSRARLRAASPSSYRWWTHAVPVLAFVLAGLWLTLSHLQSVRALELAAAVAMLLLLLFGEWAAHRYPMHVWRLPHAVYRRHVLEHHAFFTRERMEMEEPADLQWVLFPPWALPLLVVSVSPVFVALYELASPNLAWLFAFVVVAYYAIYEVVHLLTHLPAGPGRVGRAIRGIGRHHRVHHDPALMDEWNYNFVLPLFDWVFGTLWRGRSAARTLWVLVATAATLAACGDGGTPGRAPDPSAPFLGPTHCGPLARAPQVVEPIELLWGATNVNAALGSGGLTAGVSSCGEITVLKWPGPSYHDQIDYLSSNSEDARLRSQLGALPTHGVFAGIAYRTVPGEGPWKVRWLRDPGWHHRQGYAGDESGVLVHETTSDDLGLVVTAQSFVLPSRDVLVSDYAVRRRPASPVREARLLVYTNLQPTLTLTPFLPIDDWALDFANDFGALFDPDDEVLLHYRPAGATAPGDLAALGDLLRAPPADASTFEQKVREVRAGLSAPGVYLAAGLRRPGAAFQVGFDDAPACAHQSTLAERTLVLSGFPEALLAVARTQFVCEARVPDGPLETCRRDGGLAWSAPSAFDDAADGELSGSLAAACQANGALASDLVFEGDQARATFYLAAASTADEATGLVVDARRASPASLREETDAWWRSYLAPVRLPATDDPRILAFARRALISIRTATDRASGAIVASVTTQPPYGEDWPRDGAFINYALDRAGLHSLATRHNLFYRRVQRKEPAGWSFFYSFPPCDPAAPAYPSCIPAGTFEMNYFAHPSQAIPGGPTSFEIDETGLAVWTMWNHASFLEGSERGAYLDDVCESIRLGATALAECRDPDTGLQCPANEDDNADLTQGLQGAETALLGVESGLAAAADCAFDGALVDAWSARARELRAQIVGRFLDPEPRPHLAGARAPWALWPARVLDPATELGASHAAWVRQGLDDLLARRRPRSGYDAERVLVRARLAREAGDEATLAATREEVRFMVHELTTPDTLHMGEFYVLVDDDRNGDGVAPDYLQSNGVPHVWEQAYLLAAALEAFGDQRSPP